MSAVLKQLEELKKAAEINAAWDNLVSAGEIAKLADRSVKRVKELMEVNQIKPVGKLGSSHLYPKDAVLTLIKSTPI